MAAQEHEPAQTALQETPDTPDSTATLSAQPKDAALSSAAAQPVLDELPPEFLEKLRQNKRKRKIKLIITAAVIAAVLVAGIVVFLTTTSGGDDEEATTGTYTQRVTQGDLDLTVEGSGTLAASSTTSVNAQVSGTVKKIYVSEGDEVEKGDTLFTLESDELTEAIAEKKSAVSSAYSAYTQALSESSSSTSTSTSTSTEATSDDSSSDSSESANSSTPQTDAAGSGSSSSGSSESPSSSTTQTVAVGSGSSSSSSGSSGSSSSSTAQTVAASSGSSDSSGGTSSAAAYQAYQQALEEYNDALEDLEKLTVLAPSSGTVTAVSITKGDTVTAGSSAGASSQGSSSTAQVVISNMSKMSLSISVSEYDISKIKKGQAAKVTVNALGETVKAKVKSVAKTASTSSSGSSGAAGSSSSTSYYEVTLVIPKPVEGMLSGMNATASIVYESFEDALLVPTAAIATDAQGTSYVSVQAGEGEDTTSAVQVEVLGGDDETSAVAGDLAAGDAVVVTYQISESSSSSSAGQGGMQMGNMGMGSMSGGGPSGGDMPSPPSGGGNGGGPGGAPGGN